MSATIWLETPNPLALAAAPQWWQDAVHDYDADLRIMPSQKDPTYRLCRVVRAEARLGLKDAGRAHTHPDTVEMIRHFCIPVATLYRFHPQIAAELKDRDLWNAGNRDYVDQLEEMEAAQASADDQRRDEETNSMLGDSYQGLKYIKGEKVSMRDLNRGRTGKVPGGKVLKFPVGGKRQKLDTPKTKNVI